MDTFASILVSSLIISSGALIGIFTLALREEKLQKILYLTVSLSAGALMGGAFLHLLPEAAEVLGSPAIFRIALFSFIIFFLIEKIFHWRHCHKGRCDVHTFGVMNLVGDGIHNFIDGLIIAAAFAADSRLGWATAMAVALHEIPQEIGDFGVLLYAGYNKKKALAANFLTALTVVLGGIAGYYLSFTTVEFIAYLLPFAAGGFLYIGASDLMPEIRKEENFKKSMMAFGIFCVGVIMMYIFKITSPTA